jgi:hypothetical protein
MDRHGRLEPHAPDLAAARLPGVDFHFAARLRAVAVLRAHRCGLDAHRPHAPLAAEEGTQAVDGGEEVAAVLLHHREQQVAAGVAAKTSVLLERRQAREKNAPRLAFVARQGEGAFQHVAGRQHAQLVAQLAGAAAAVEHGDDGVQPQPGVRLETAKQAGQPRAAAKAADVQLA